MSDDQANPRESVVPAYVAITLVPVASEHAPFILGRHSTHDGGSMNHSTVQLEA